MRTLRRLGNFVQRIGAGLRGCDLRFVREMVLGIAMRRDVMLSEIGRALREGIEFEKTECRLSRSFTASWSRSFVTQRGRVLALRRRGMKVGRVAQSAKRGLRRIRAGAMAREVDRGPFGQKVASSSVSWRTRSR
jgi:hypothetical protein